MSEEVHVGDVGTVFQITVLDGDGGPVLDISSATEMKLFLRKPNDTVLSNVAVHVTDGTDGKMKYVGQAGDIDMAGRWFMQGKIVLPAGTWYTDTTSFVVEDRLAT